VHHGGQRVRPGIPSGQILLWKDIFAVVSNGRLRPEEFELLRQLLVAQAEQFPTGIGCLTIVPKDATPPSDASRRALNAALGRVEGSMRAICWLVEGDGFQGAMVQAVVAGLRVAARQWPYATHVCTSLDEALAWLLLQLPRPGRRASDIAEARKALLHQRAGGEIKPSVRPSKL
jgi:hypothetical protein